MRHFHSHGPVEPEAHFFVPRRELVETCTEQLIGRPGESGGHYFTIWAPRQTGKTWLMREARRQIKERCGDQFIVADMSMQRVILHKSDTEEQFLSDLPHHLQFEFGFDEAPSVVRWSDFADVFRTERRHFDRPLILFIDEFDKLPPHIIDRVVNLFRDMYLRRDKYLLHGLALIGVRSVLGLESQRGSPFNIQRSLHVPNFSEEEVTDLFRQYQDESGQKVEPWVVAEICKVTRGQPGLVCWFGELLTEKKYNPDRQNAIDAAAWRKAYHAALFREWNNTVLNLVKKAKGEYEPQVLELFARSDIEFRLDTDWCNYLYFNGIIDAETATDEQGNEVEICRFSSPFVQERLYNALTDHLVGDRLPILPLEVLDDLADVFAGDRMNLPALLERYRAYLARLGAQGINPWEGQPRRSDLRLTEAVGQFHLYAWLRAAVNGYAAVSPEFPTGNGAVDLHIRTGEAEAIIEVKSFANLRQLSSSREQAARYAASLGLDSVTLALFVASKDEEVLRKLSGETTIDNTRVFVVPIGWDVA